MALNVSRAEVHGVVSFYHDFRADAAGSSCSETLPRPRPAKAMGAIKLADAPVAPREYGVAWGGTTAGRQR